VLGSTYETVTLPDDIAARLEGKSSLGRLGCSRTPPRASSTRLHRARHPRAVNVATLPIMLWPGMKIGQLCFFRRLLRAENPYGSAASGSRYQGQRGPTASRSHLSFHRTPV
jgi:dCTP deaminase